MSDDRRRGSNVVPLQRPAQRPAPPIERFQPYYAAQMQGVTVPAREWLVDSILMPKTVCLFAGPPKIGKSLLMQHLLTATALGEPWLNHAVVQARSFGMFTEDPNDEMQRRQAQINSFFDRSPADYELELSWEAREGKEALLVEFERFTDRPIFTPLWDQLWNFVRDAGVRVVALDPAAVIFGGNELFRSQVTVFMRELVKQAVRMDGAVILSVHPAKNSPHGFSGSTAWHASARFGMSLGRPSDYDPEIDQPRDARVLRPLGGNYGPGLRPMRLDYDKGVFVPAEEEIARRRAPLNHQERAELRYRLLIGMKRVLADGGHIMADIEHKTSLPHRARHSTDAQLASVPLNDLYVAQQEMIDTGLIIRVVVGRNVLLRPADGGPFYRDEKPWVVPV